LPNSDKFNCKFLANGIEVSTEKGNIMASIKSGKVPRRPSCL